MADYSGAWHCDECQASGTGYSRSHKPWCSVTLRLAQDAQKRRERDAAELERKRQIRAEWEELTDEEFLARIEEVRRVKDDAADRLSELKELADEGWKVARTRGLDTIYWDRRFAKA